MTQAWHGLAWVPPHQEPWPDVCTRGRRVGEVFAGLVGRNPLWFARHAEHTEVWRVWAGRSVNVFTNSSVWNKHKDNNTYCIVIFIIQRCIFEKYFQVLVFVFEEFLKTNLYLYLYLLIEIIVILITNTFYFKKLSLHEVYFWQVKVLHDVLMLLKFLKLTLLNK